MDRQFLVRARLLAGVVAPLGVLAVDSLIRNLREAAVIAGGLSVFMLALLTVMLGDPKLPRFSYIPNVLLWAATPIGLVAWGRGLPLLVAALLVLTLMMGAVALVKGGPTLVFCTLVHAGVLAYLMYSAIYVGWLDGAVWGGSVLLVSVAVHVVGLLIMRRGVLPAFFQGVCLSGLPLAVLLWGLGAPVPGAIGGVVTVVGWFGLSQVEKPHNPQA